MKKSIRVIAVTCIAACVAVSLPFPQCNEGCVQAALKFKLNSKKVTVTVGKKKTVKYTAPAKIKLSCSNKKIAKASVLGKKIVIKGVKKGTAKIAVKCRKKQIKIKVTVKKSKAVNKKPVLTPTVAPTKLQSATPTATTTPTVDPQTALAYAKSIAAYSNAGNKFTYEVFNKIKKSGENTFISPYSIYTALAMLTNGAEGNTKTQLMTALGITDLSDLNMKMSGYLKGGLDEKINLNIANSLWLSNKLVPSAGIDNNFIAPLQQCYNAEVQKNFDFTAPNAVDTLNGWVSDKTNGMIKKTFTEVAGLDATLINTVYFKGGWASGFNPNYTIDDTFHGTKGDSVVKMMQKSDSYYKYYKDDVFTGLSMDYGSGKYTMDVLMSTDESKMSGDVWSSLTTDQQIAVVAAMDSKSSATKIRNLKFPKFKMEYNASGETGGKSIDTVMKELGLKDMYAPGIANFSNISSGFCVGGIIHKTALNIDEYGTEAAAVTAIVAAACIAPTKDEKITDFIVNRPFVFCIRDRISGIILFIGEVNNI